MTAPTTPTESRLRDALAAAAPADTHLEPGLADLRQRIEDGAAVPAPVALADRRLPRSTRRLLAVAAALVLIVGIAALVQRQGDRGDRVITQSSVPSATGWYIPKGLSSDWQLKSVTTETNGVEKQPGSCPCRRLVWVGTDETKAMRLKELTTDADVSELLEGIDATDITEGIDLGHGITGTAGVETFNDGVEPRTAPFLVWDHDGTRSILVGNEVSADELVTGARGIVDTGEPGDDALPGAHLVDEVSVPEDLTSSTSVHVVMENTTTGAVETYVLVPPGLDVLDPTHAPIVVDLPGAPGPLLAVVSDALDGTSGQATTYMGRWPGATITTGAVVDVDPPPGPPAALREVLASLRPATADEWAAFGDAAVDSADRSELHVPTLRDLSVAGNEPSGGSDHTTTAATGSGDPTPTGTEPSEGESDGQPSGDLTAEDLAFAPVLGIGMCDGDVGTFPAEVRDQVVPSSDGSTCYLLGDVVADGTDLQHDPIGQVGEDGAGLNVEARPGAVDRLNGLFNACYDADDSCPALAGDRGAIAMVWDGRVISAPAVNAPDLAGDGFMIFGFADEAEATAVIEAINAG